MNKNEKTIKQLLTELFTISKKLAFVDVKTQDGSMLRTPDEALKVGSQVTCVGADGTETPTTDGDYTTEDGSKVTVKSGVVEAIVPASPDAGQPLPTDASTTPDNKPNPNALAAPDNSAPAPTDGTPAPQSGYDGDPNAPAADGDDMTKLLEIIKNITDRISALEEKVGETKMAVQKMAEAPAAKAFNSNSSTKATIGDYIKAYKNDYKTMVSKNKEKLENIKLSPKPAPQVFKKNEQSAPTNKPKPKIDLGRFGKMSISNE